MLVITRDGLRPPERNFFEAINTFELYNGNYSESQSDYKYKFAFPYERLGRENCKAITLFMQRYWLHTFTVSLLYYASMNGLRWFMRNRAAFDLRRPLLLWNVALAIFSISGVVRMSEEVLDSFSRRGLHKTLCQPPDTSDVAAFWCFLFAVSKLVELGDTLFIVLRKKRLIFLHYYHHAVVLIYTIHSGAEHAAPGRLFVTMNYAAHSFMYTYYAVAAAGWRMPRWVAMSVTTIQTVQMLTGVAISCTVYWMKTNGMMCQQSMANLYLAFMIYATFAFLFIQFYVKTYLKGKEGTEKKEKKQ